MKIAVIGCGNVGSTLGRRWALKGHDLIFGVRNPEKDKVVATLEACEGKARATSIKEAAAEAEVIVYAAWWSAAEEVCQEIGDFENKVLIDCVNPLKFGANGLEGIELGFDTSAGEVLQAVEQDGKRPLDSLFELGLIGPRSQCVHMTDLGEQDINLLLQSGAHVVHCPQSNMKLASGTCPVSKLLATGVNVALGTDSAASNNDLNLFGEMQAAALLAKVSSGDATALPASEALAMATINGARAMGLEDELGSVEAGKQADLISVDLSGPETQPLYNPLSQLVYACNGSQVQNSWIAGKQVLANRELTTLNLDNLNSRVTGWQQRIQASKAQTNTQASGEAAS